MELLITIAIGLAAATYVAAVVRRSAKKLLGTAASGGACNSCTGCGTPAGHAESESGCQVRQRELVVLRSSPQTQR